MTTHLPARPPTIRAARLGLLIGLAWAWACPAIAQLDQGIRSWADAVGGVTTAKWAGERVPYPTPEPRPQGLLAIDAMDAPLRLHFHASTPPRRVQRALEALVDAHALLEEVGFDTRATDGGLGGDSQLDIYLVDHLPEGARAGVDASEPISYLDAASTFGLTDARVPEQRLGACVSAAYAQALLKARDPAEAESVQRAGGAYLAWLLTGEPGCDDTPLLPWRQPERTLMGQSPDASGAGFWALLGWRQDQNRGRYVLNIWEVARQRTWEGQDLRGSPDAWEATQAVLKAHREEFAPILDELAVARYLVGPRLFAGAERPPLAGHYRYDELPVRTRPQTLQTLGSTYFVVDTAGASGKALRLWLRGEYGVRWAMSAVRLSAEGRDLGRVSAPAREYPRSYLAVTLDPDTAQVLVVISNLSSRLPDADAPDENERAAHLILDRGEPGMAETSPQEH